MEERRGEGKERYENEVERADFFWSSQNRLLRVRSR